MMPEMEAMDGAKVFVGEHLCGVINYENASGKSFSQYVDVACNDVVGTSVKIEHKDKGVALCDITAYKGDRFPAELPFIYG